MGPISILAAGVCPDSPMIVGETGHRDYINYSACVCVYEESGHLQVEKVSEKLRDNMRSCMHKYAELN